MNKTYDALEICLQELENGADMKTVLARYPELANELRPMLEASIAARKLAAQRDPSPEVLRRGRAKLLQRASEMREAKLAPRKRIIPLFQRLAISFTLTATFLLSGTGLVGASSSALPGQKLYPVKRGWEDVRLFLAFNQETHSSLEQEFEQERLQEVDELLIEKEHLSVEFSGVLVNKNGMTYVSDVQVLFPANAQIPNEGATLHILGLTTNKGYVEVTRFDVLQGIPTATKSKSKPESTHVDQPTQQPTEQPIEQPTEQPTESVSESPESTSQPTEVNQPSEGTPEPPEINKNKEKDKGEKDGETNTNETETGN